MTTVDDLCRSLSGALGLLPVSVFVFDADAVCTLSVGGGDKAGMPQPTIVGRRLLDDYADLPEVVGALRRTLTGQPAVAAATVHGVTWETYFRPLTDDTGRVVGGVGLALDITERTTVDALLQQSELDAQHLLRAIPDQLVWLDAEGHVLASKATRVGHDDQRVSAAAIGSVVDEVLDRRLVAELHTNMRMALANAETRTFDYHVTEGDTERYFEARVVPGRADTVLLMLRDVTERQRLTDELQQAQRLEAIGRLAGGIAHEINTPIQFIGDNVRFLRESFVTTVKLLDAYRACLYGERDLSRAERVAMAQAAEDDADVGFLMKEVPQAAQETLEGVERVATIVGRDEGGRPPIADRSAPRRPQRGDREHPDRQPQRVQAHR